jgi:thiol:disulfide interchange protein DsbC
MFKKCIKYTLVVALLFAFGPAMADSEEQKAAARVKALSKIDAKEMIVYPASNGQPKAHVTVFTDMDCSYCRKQHQEIAKANALGIEVRCLSYPRRGEGSDSYKKMVTVWCAPTPEERKKLMESAMEGNELTIKTCDHPINDHRNLGRQLGVSGTPTLVFADGTVWGGYLPAEKLAREAIKHKSKSGEESNNARSSR